MKKKWLFAAILALVFAACMAVFAACGGNGSYDAATCVRAGTVLIADGAFNYNKNINGCLVLPESVRYIGNKAFIESSVDAVVAPGVERIGDYAFAEAGLSYIVAGNSLQEIGEYFFRGFHNSYFYFEGSRQQWEKVEIAPSDNTPSIVESTVYFYSENAPQGEGNYWHYVNGEPLQWQ